MGAVPIDVDTDAGPPTAVPLRHFVVALALLGAAAVVGVGLAVDAVPGLGGLVHVHLFLVGWVCVTIMGAMTQFVPVWSGTALHSERLANAQLAATVVGVVGLVAGLALARPAWLPAFGALLLAGVWTFVYNVARTLPSPGDLDATERHFAVALGFFVAVTGLGLLLAASLARPVLSGLGVSRVGVRGAHATAAVFGAVLTTVYGALYQLGPMFTQTDLDGLDRRLRRVEELCHPLGVTALAWGRLLGAAWPARVGAAAVLVAAAAFAVVLARTLVAARVERTPVLTRYGAVAAALPAWALTAAPAWLRSPLAPEAVLGGPGSAPTLLGGVIGLVVFGTLYHVIPFLVWVHRYSDRVGLEPVPTVDDLYDDRLAAADGGLLFAGTLALVAADLAAGGTGSALVGGDSALALAGSAAFALGVAVATANLTGVIRRHGADPLDTVALGRLSPLRVARSGDDEGADRPGDPPTDG